MLADRRIVVPAAILLAAILYATAAGGHLGYDAAYQLVWAHDLAGGRLPQYDVRLAPTPHPLQILAGVPAAALGSASDEAMRALSLLAFGLLAAGIARAGALLFTPWVGLLAAAVTATRPHLVEMAQLGDAAIPAAALIVWAGVLALRSPPAHAGALSLVGAAGLLRPEAWALAAAYGLWAARVRRVRSAALPAALAVAGPVAWMLSDLAVTGDPLWSLHHTRDGTVLLDRPTGVIAGLEQGPRHLNFLLGPAVLATGALGFVAGGLVAPRRMAGFAAAMVLAGGGFMVLAVAGLSLQPRYLAPLAAGIALCAAVGALGWTALAAADRRRGRWRAAGWAALALLVAGLPWDVAEHASVRSALVDEGGRLEELARADARAALTGCPPVAVPTIRPIPYLALWSGARPADFVEAGGPAGTGATLVTPTPVSESYVGGGGEGRPQRVVAAPGPGQRLVAANESWRVYSRC